MTAPPAAIAALVWAVVGPPLVVLAATGARHGPIAVHVTLMTVSVVIEVGVVVGFSFLMSPSPRRAALTALPVFIAALMGMAWQLTSRAVPRLRPLHRLTGPSVVLMWCLALLTGIYNYVFLYVMAPP